MRIEQFLEVKGHLIDVRSPSEYAQGRIPGAVSLPLFTDEERSQLGTVYKQKGHIEAIELGIQLFQPKIRDYVAKAKKLGRVKIYCWRGGMRSTAVSQLLQSKFTLDGGYKAFRRRVNKIFNFPFDYCVLGGFTGCGKTEVLHELNTKGEQVLDLEGLANHRGSCFGGIGMPPQPSTEQFHNEIAWHLMTFDPNKPIWIEDESRLIGTCHLPESLYKHMQQSPLYMIERPFSERFKKLQQNYRHAKREEIIESVLKLRKKLGNEKTQRILNHIHSGRHEQACKEVLQYYDSSYLFCLSKRKNFKLFNYFML